MSQQCLGFNQICKLRTCKAFLGDDMDLVVSWSEFLAFIAPHSPKVKNGGPRFNSNSILRNFYDRTQTSKLVNTDETDVSTDASYQGAVKGEEVPGIKARWHLSMRKNKRQALDKCRPVESMLIKSKQITTHIQKPGWSPVSSN